MQDEKKIPLFELSLTGYHLYSVSQRTNTQAKMKNTKPIGRGTRPLGDGTVNITFNAPSQMREGIQKLAQKSGMKMGEYLREITNKAITNNTIFGVIEIVDNTPTRKMAR